MFHVEKDGKMALLTPWVNLYDYLGAMPITTIEIQRQTDKNIKYKC